MTDLEDLLKYNEIARLTVGHKWLVWGDDVIGWEVWEHAYGKRKTTRLYAGMELAQAIHILTEA